MLLIRSCSGPACAKPRLGWRTAALGALAWLTVVGASPSASAQSECRVHWEVTAQLDRQPATLGVQMSFDAGPRTLTHLRLPGGWQATQAAPESTPMLGSVADNPQLRQVRHAPGQRVQLQWQYTPQLAAQSGGALLAEKWFAFTAGTALPWPEELGQGGASTVACVSLSGPPGSTRLLSSFGRADGDRTQWRLSTTAAQWPRAVFAAGTWQVRDVMIPGQAITVAMPEPAPFGFGISALDKAVASTLAGLRQPWGSPESAPLLVLLLPGATAPAGLALHQALVVQAPPSMPLPSEKFDELLAGQWLRGWLPERLGPLAHQGRGDAVLRAWFSEGLADYLAHRWLLREGRWTPADYAEALNRKISRYQALPEIDASNQRVATGGAGEPALAVLPAARGEFLALAWHDALLRAGQPGLEQVLYGLLVPAAQARPEGPTSAPLATHRLLAALRRSLGDLPLKTMGQHIDEGLPFRFGAQSLGPCFQWQGPGNPTRYQPVDQAQQRSDCQAWMRAPDAPSNESATAGPAAKTAAAVGAFGRTAERHPARSPAARSAPAAGPTSTALPARQAMAQRRGPPPRAASTRQPKPTSSARTSPRSEPRAEPRTTQRARPPMARSSASPSAKPVVKPPRAKPGTSKPATKPAAKPSPPAKSRSAAQR